MTAAIRPASLWTHSMAAVLARTEKSGDSRVQLTRQAELRAELCQWLQLTTTTQQGPWQRARHFTAALTGGATDASSNAWGGVINTTTGPLLTDRDFPSEWSARHIINKKMLALHEVLLNCMRYCCSTVNNTLVRCSGRRSGRMLTTNR